MSERAPSRWASFWEGLWRPSLASCIGALVVGLLELAFWCAVVTPERLAHLDAKILMENPRDDYARITVNALRLRYAVPRGLNVAYIGASSARQALLHSESPRLIQEYLTAQLGEKTTFHFLCADAETLVEAVALSEQLPEAFRGVAVVTISDYRDEGREHDFRQHDRMFRAGSRLALYSPDADDLARSLGQPTTPNTGIYFLDYFPFFAVRRVTGARIYRSAQKPVNEGLPAALTPQQQAALATRMSRVWELVRRDYEARPKLAILNEDEPILERLVATWKKHHITGILLEAPENTKYNEVKNGMREVYRKEMPLFAQRLGVEYWDLNPEVGLKPTDFADHVHLLDRAARFRFQAAFVRRLAVFMKPMARGAAPGPPEPAPEGRDGERD